MFYRKAMAARLMRKGATAAERALWELLRNRRFLGLKFRRQVPVAGYMADFLCIEHQLVVEVDGGVHEAPDQLIHDAERDATLRELGYAILRLRNEQVLDQPQAALERLHRALTPLAPLSPEGGGRGDH